MKRVAEVLENVAAIHYIEMVVFKLQRMSIALSEIKVWQGSLNESQLLTGIFHANDFSLWHKSSNVLCQNSESAADLQHGTCFFNLQEVNE